LWRLVRFYAEIHGGNDPDVSSTIAYFDSASFASGVTYRASARIYNPVQGRWISPDMGFSVSANPKDMNGYIYAANDQTKNVDPTGNDECVSSEC
jgi:RHS repeat-associated protein